MDPTAIRRIMLEAAEGGDWTLASALARTLKGYVAMGLVPRDIVPEDAHDEAHAILRAAEHHLDPEPARIGR